MLAEIFMLRCEAEARRDQSEHAANEAAACWLFVLLVLLATAGRKPAAAWNRCLLAVRFR
jgi:hypothetical protein